MSVMCERCKVRESTGYLVLLCDECFDEWEKEVQQGKVDIAPVDPACKLVSGGGLIPDDCPGVSLKFDGENVRVTPAREAQP